MHDSLEGIQHSIETSRQIKGGRFSAGLFGSLGSPIGTMGLADQKLVMDMVAWAGNVSSSVLIIFVNKVLMNRTGYGFQYGGFSLNYILPWRKVKPVESWLVGLKSTGSGLILW